MSLPKKKEKSIKRMDIREFREKGYLQELNRMFLHPLGLAMEISIDEAGKETLGGVWDYRDDPEGILYHESTVDSEAYSRKMRDIAAELQEKLDYRYKNLGFRIQSEPKEASPYSGTLICSVCESSNNPLEYSRNGIICNSCLDRQERDI